MFEKFGARRINMLSFIQVSAESIVNRHTDRLTNEYLYMYNMYTVEQNIIWSADFGNLSTNLKSLQYILPVMTEKH